MSVAAFAGASAVVTGAASGIGLALVRRLAAAGADVLGVDVAAVPAADGVRSVAADVGDPDAWARVAAQLDHVDLAFLNAGVTSSAPSFLDTSWEEARAVLRVNLEGVLLGLRTLVPLVPETGGAVVVTASGGAIEPVQTDPVYTASKLGAVGLVRAAAPPLAARGIRLSAVCPSLVDTPLLGTVGRLMGMAGFGLLSGRRRRGGAASRRARGGARRGLGPAPRHRRLPDLVPSVRAPRARCRRGGPRPARQRPSGAPRR